MADPTTTTAHHPGTGPGQIQRDGPANAATRPRHQSHLPRQIHCIPDHLNTPCSAVRVFP